MKKTLRLGLLVSLGVVTALTACGDDDDGSVPPLPMNTAGTGGATGGSGGSTTAGTGGTPVTAGTGGALGGTGGATGGTGGTGGSGGNATAGTGGTPMPVMPTIFLIDNVRLQKKGEGAGGAGSGGAGGADSGGAPGAGGTPDAGGAAGAPVGAAGAPAAGGASGAGGAGPAAVDWSFSVTFDADLTSTPPQYGPLAKHGDGFSPGPGGSMGPVIVNNTTIVWEDGTGVEGGAAKVSVPFSVAKQQADFAGTFPSPADLTGYELTADVKIQMEGDIGDCPTAWMYVYGGNGYANDATGEPAANTTSHLTPNEWNTVRLDLDGPYGEHTTATFDPTLTNIWGIQLNTWGCP